MMQGLQCCYFDQYVFQQIAENAYNYDAWFDYIRLLQNEKVDRDEMEDTFERAIANVPLQPEKR